MTNIALITTTINVPHVLTQWAESMTSDDIIIVAGDKKSPHDEIDKLLDDISMSTGVATTYLHPNGQFEYESSEYIGWNCIQRRNIALLEAMREKPRFILTVDDDNAPTRLGQVQALKSQFGRTNHDYITTNTGWYNPGRACQTRTPSLQSVVHRGMPMSRRHERPVMSRAATCEIGVAAMLWTGSPDIDAIERIVNDPTVERIFHDNTVLIPGTWAPFNSQATMYRTELAPLMYVWPHVGRYDDIWASYLARTVMDQLRLGVYYGHPAVHQARNPHNLMRDLEDEMFGMKHTEELCDILRRIDWTGMVSTSIVDMMEYVVAVLESEATFLSALHTEPLRIWISDVKQVMSNG